jgi:hypothetical protein
MKGVWFTMESAIACIVIGMFLIFIGGSYLSSSEQVDASRLAYDILKSLDDRGILRSDAVDKNITNLNANIEATGYNHTIIICDDAGSCAGTEPEASDVWVGSYFIAGQSIYQPLEIKLFLWEELS